MQSAGWVCNHLTQSQDGHSVSMNDREFPETHRDCITQFSLQILNTALAPSSLCWTSSLHQAQYSWMVMNCGLPVKCPLSRMQSKNKSASLPNCLWLNFFADLWLRTTVQPLAGGTGCGTKGHLQGLMVRGRRTEPGPGSCPGPIFQVSSGGTSVLWAVSPISTWTQKNPS